MDYFFGFQISDSAPAQHAQSPNACAAPMNARKNRDKRPFASSVPLGQNLPVYIVYLAPRKRKEFTKFLY
jgi:hypothetical protein